MVTLTVGKKRKLSAVWSSASKAIATVSETGTVTAVSPGTVEIYCAIGDAPPSVEIISVTAKK